MVDEEKDRPDSMKDVCASGRGMARSRTRLGAAGSLHKPERARLNVLG